MCTGMGARSTTSHLRGKRISLRVLRSLSLVGALILALLLTVKPNAVHATLGEEAWALVAVLIVLGVLPLPRPGVALLVFTAAAAVVAALVAYVVMASTPAQPTVPGIPSPSTPSVVSSIPSEGPSSAPFRPLRHPRLGISAATVADLDRFVAVTHTRPEVFDVFEAWSLNRPLQRSVAESITARGARLSITWEPWDTTAPHTNQPRYTLESIINGEHDDYIDMFASSIKEYPHPVTIRLMHEMNGNWYPWGSGVNGNKPGEFVLAWQHVHNRFTALGATNVDWMWAPNAVYTGGAPLPPLYPGDAYVNAVGLSNYNWGERHHDGFATHWRTFGSLFDDSIAQLQLITNRPLWIAEVGSSNSGGSKAAWLAAMLQEVQQRPEIVGLVWFDHVDKQRRVDWRIETEVDTADAWRSGFNSRPKTTHNNGAVGRRAE